MALRETIAISWMILSELGHGIISGRDRTSLWRTVRAEEALRRSPRRQRAASRCQGCAPHGIGEARFSAAAIARWRDRRPQPLGALAARRIPIDGRVRLRGGGYRLYPARAIPAEAGSAAGGYIVPCP